MKAAMKVFNDSMKKSSFSQLKETSLKSAINIIQEEWFKVSTIGFETSNFSFPLKYLWSRYLHNVIELKTRWIQVKLFRV